MGKTYDDEISPDEMRTDGDLSPEECDEVEAGEVEAEEETEAEAEEDLTQEEEDYLTEKPGVRFYRVWDKSMRMDHRIDDFNPRRKDSLCSVLRKMTKSDVKWSAKMLGGVDSQRLHIGMAELVAYHWSDVQATADEIGFRVNYVIGLVNDMVQVIYDETVAAEELRMTMGGKYKTSKEVQSAARRNAREITPKRISSLPIECITPLAIGFFGLHLIDTSDGDGSSESATKIGYYDDGSDLYHIEGRDTKGIWVTDDRAVYRLFRLIDATLTDKQITTVIVPQISAYLMGYAPRNRKANHDPFLIPCKNGVYDWKHKTFRDFSKDDTFIWKLRVPYNPAAKNPVRDLVDIYGQPTGEKWDLDSWIYDLFTDDSLTDADSQRRAAEDSRFILEQWIPYMLTPAHAWDKSFIFCSEQGSGGKGCLILLIRSLIGDRAIAEIKLADFDKSFSLQELYEYNKRVIVSEENPVRTFIDAAALYKALITGDFTSIQQKFKSTVTARIRASQTHCVNEIPRVADTSDSYVRRHIFLRFHKNFAKSGEHKEIKQEFLSDPEVLEYVLKIALEAPFRKSLTPTESMGEVLKEFQTLNNPMQRFWEDILDFMDKHVIEIPTETLYPVFQTWYKDNVRGSSGYGSSEFKKMMRDVVYNAPDFMYDQNAYFKNSMSLVSDAAQALFEAGWITYDEVHSMLYGKPKTYRGSIKRRELKAADKGKIGIRDSFGKVIPQYETVTDDDAMVRSAGWDMTEVEDKTADDFEKDKKKHWIYTNKTTGKKYEKTDKSCFGTYGPSGKYHVPLILRMFRDESPVQGI